MLINKIIFNYSLSISNSFLVYNIIETASSVCYKYILIEIVFLQKVLNPMILNHFLFGTVWCHIKPLKQ